MNAKMALWSLLVVTLAVVSSHPRSFRFHDPCINSSVCSCEGATIACNCSTTSASAHLVIWPFTLQQRSSALSSLSIRGCPSLRLHQAALPSCPPGGVLVEGVPRVELDSLSFHEMLDCSSLEFVSIGFALVKPFAFHVIRRVRSIEFRDVTLTTLQSRTFDALGAVGTLSFVNCTLGALESRAISNSTRIDRLRFVHCTIEELSGETVEAEEVGHFELVNSTVGLWGHRALALANSRRVTVRGNRVGKLDARAFDGLMTMALDVRVMGNDFGGGDDSAEALVSLFDPSLPVNGTLVVRDNRLPCDERLCRLLSAQSRDEQAADVAAFLAMTKCANSTRTLAEFLTLADDDDVCPFAGHASGAGNAAYGTSATTASASGASRLAIGVAAMALFLRRFVLSL